MTRSIVWKKHTRWMILTISFLMALVGIAGGEARTVLGKAINICLECIGIG